MVTLSTGQPFILSGIIRWKTQLDMPLVLHTLGSLCCKVSRYHANVHVLGSHYYNQFFRFGVVLALNRQLQTAS